MRIARIEIENFLAFEGMVDIPMPSTGAPDDVVVVHAPAGGGKSSLLVALRVALVGLADGETRTVGFPPRTLPPASFVLGSECGWPGLRNRAAAATDPDMACRIRIGLHIADRRLTVERAWTFAGSGYEEHLVVEERDLRSTGQDAERRLRTLFPPKLAPLVLTTGENAKALAASTVGSRRTLERVSGTGFLRRLGDAARALAEQRRKQAGQLLGPSDLKRRLSWATSEAGSAKAARSEAEAQLYHAREQLVELDGELKRLEAIAGFAGSAGERRYRLIDAENQLNREIRQRLAELPLIVNPELLAEAADQAARVVRSDAPTLRQVLGLMPDLLSRAAPQLDERTKATIIDDLKAEAEVREQVRPAPFASVDGGRLTTLSAELGMSSRDAGRRRRWISSAVRESKAMRAERVSDQTHIRETDGGSFSLFHGAVAEARIEVASCSKAVQEAEYRLEERQRLLDEARRRQAKLEDALLDVNRSRAVPDRQPDFEDLGDCLDEMVEGLTDIVRRRIRTALDAIDDASKGSLGSIRILLDADGALRFEDRLGRRITFAEMSFRDREAAGAVMLRALQIAFAADLPIVLDDALGCVAPPDRIFALGGFLSAALSQTILLARTKGVELVIAGLPPERLAGVVDLHRLRSAPETSRLKPDGARP